MKKKLFVLSMDAMIHEDVAYMMEKPNFAKIMAHRAEVEKVRSVYPASTYPAHTTLMTGCYPGKHGVWANVPLKTVADNITHWPLFHKLIEVEDLFAAAKRAGCSTASVYWPMTACNPNIDHIINEYFFFYPKEKEDLEEAFRKMGADEAAIQAVRENTHKFPFKTSFTRDGLYNSFINGCACSLIRNVQPDVMLIHNCWLDSLRHAYGVFDEKVMKGLDDMDEWLGEIIEAMEDAGVYEETNFVILSDHGQRDYRRIVKLNVLLNQGGFIDLAPDGSESIYDWRAFAQSNGRSATVYLLDHTNPKLYQRVYDYLNRLKEEGTWGIEAVYTADELYERYGQRGPYAFMVESDENTSFDSSWVGNAVQELEEGGVKGAHGYEPEKGPQPVFLAHGPQFKEGAVISRTDMVNIAPTLAGALGQTMPEADGRVLNELLK